MLNFNSLQYAAEYALLPQQSAKAFEKRQPPFAYKTVLVATFPYFSGFHDGNLSLYTMGEDYHVVLKQILSNFIKDNHEILGNHRIFIDSSLFYEKNLAEHAKLGGIGRNGLLMHEKHGSFIFIGGIVIENEFPEMIGSTENPCNGCLACERACPTGAISTGMLDKSRCLSALSQKKTLTADEEKLLGTAELIWGCDSCQTACPVNMSSKHTENPKFNNNLIKSLSHENIAAMNDEDYSKAYSLRAFSYRKRNVILRNFELTQKKAKNKTN